MRIILKIRNPIRINYNWPRDVPLCLSITCSTLEKRGVKWLNQWKRTPIFTACNQQKHKNNVLPSNRRRHSALICWEFWHLTIHSFRWPKSGLVRKNHCVITMSCVFRRFCKKTSTGNVMWVRAFGATQKSSAITDGNPLEHRFHLSGTSPPSFFVQTLVFHEPMI